MKEIIIIGAGVIGCSIARELSRYDAKITVIERENDVACGTTKANSGVVHGGFDAKPGSKKAFYNVRGNAMFDKLSKELDFPFRRNGAYVLCFDDTKWDGLKKLYDQGIANGVRDIKVVTGDEVRQREPYVSEEVKGALWCPSSGIVSPYEMTIAYAENAAANGVEFVFEKNVKKLEKDGEKMKVVCEDGEVYTADLVVNAAGLHSDDLNNTICDKKYRIVPRKGEYMLLDKTSGYLTSTTLFQLPTAMGKGILVVPSVHGNILLGPTAVDIEDKECKDTTYDGLAEAFDKARITMPSLTKKTVITQFTGLRAHADAGDFVIGFAADDLPLYNLIGIESPGLTAAPAIAVDASEEIADWLALSFNKKFNPVRKGIPCFATMTERERAEIIKKNPLYGRIVCRCEVVTEGEIVDSINRPVGAKDLDGVKRRTRAGMGRCQSGFCSERVMEIIARERGIDMTEVTKSGKGSEILVGRVE